MQAQAVFFDAGNTIIYAHPPVGQVYADALRAAGVEAEPDDVAARFRETFARHVRARATNALDAAGGADSKEWWRRVVRECFEPYGPLDSFDEIFQGLWDHFACGDAWRIYDDVLPTFDALRARGKTLGLISNWDARLDGILRDLGLTRRLDSVVISHQVGAEKPAPAIFRRAVELCGLAPGLALHVGDSYEEDVVGARAAGMQAVWLCRDGATSRTEADVPVVASLRELLDLVT